MYIVFYKGLPQTPHKAIHCSIISCVLIHTVYCYVIAATVISQLEHQKW